MESSASWQIRPARQEDAGAIWNLIVDLAVFERLEDSLGGSAEAVDRWLFNEPVASALVAEVDHELIGYAIFLPSIATFKMKPGLWLEDLYVSESFRGRGVGKALITAVIAIATEKGYARVDWTVLDWNSGAIGFYRSLGAEVLPDWRVCRFHVKENELKTN